MRVAVTGAAGFIGAQVAAAFLDAGHEVIGIDRLRSGGEDARLHRAWSALRRNQKFEPVHADLLDVDLVSTLRDVDAVVNLAGRPGTHESWSDFPAYLRDNVECVDRLAQACIDAHVTRLVHASSSSVYGRLAIGSEDVELAPISLYGVSKLAGEATLRAHHAALGLPMVLLRFFSVYGPGQRPDMGVYRAIEAALTGRRFQLHGTGLQTRSMTYVDDLVAGIMLATESPMDGQTYNLGGSSAVSMIEVLQEVGRLVGRPAHVVGVEDPPGNQQHTSADLANATMELGYAPKVGLTEGLARQVEWQRGQLAV